MRQKIVELDNQRQEVVPRQVGLVPERLQVVLEGMGATLDRREAQGRRLALDGVRLPEKSIELLTEHALFPGRLAKHRIDHLHCRVRIVQERRKLRGIDVQDAEQGVDLSLSLALRGLQFTGKID